MASRALKLDPEQSEKGHVTSEALEESVRPALLNNANEKEIALLAYQFWQERGCPIGSDQDDWFRAEREVARSKIRDDDEVGSESADERSMARGEETDSPPLRFPVRCELSQASHLRALRRA
jgi:hypothetical protein